MARAVPAASEDLVPTAWLLLLQVHLRVLDRSEGAPLSPGKDSAAPLGLGGSVARAVPRVDAWPKAAYSAGAEEAVMVAAEAAGWVAKP